MTNIDRPSTEEDKLTLLNTFIPPKLSNLTCQAAEEEIHAKRTTLCSHPPPLIQKHTSFRRAIAPLASPFPVFTRR